LSIDYLPAQPEPHDTSPLDALHRHFLAILPRIETHALISFRHLRCPGRREDAIAEVVAFAWLWFLRLAQQPDKDVNDFVSTLATYAVRHVRSGRRLAGMEKSRDALNPHAQRRHNFKVESLSHSTRCGYERIYGEPFGQQTMDAFEERLRDNTQSPVADQAAFRIDFPVWLSQLGPRNREIAQDMAQDLRTKELAAKHGTTPGRISQLRREFHADWLRFHGEVL
jgi:hypothetical protein